MKRIVPAGLVIYALIGGRAVAKEDTTPPVLLDLRSAPFCSTPRSATSQWRPA